MAFLDKLKAGLQKTKKALFAPIDQMLKAFTKVDEELLDAFEVGFGHAAFKHIDLGGAHGGAVALGHELDALGGGVGALVELAGQGFHSEHKAFGQFGEGVVHLGFGEHGLHGALEHGVVEAFHVVAVHKAQAGEGADAEERAQFVQEALGLMAQAGLLFHIDTSDHGYFLLGRGRRPRLNRPEEAGSQGGAEPPPLGAV